MTDNSQAIESPRKTRAKRTSAPVVVESVLNSKKPLLKQGTTWAGIFTVAAAIASGGASVLADPTLLSMVGSGIALLFAEN